MARIGFIGLGNMGLPMAQNLLHAGHQIEGVDEATAREAFRLAGAKLSVSTMFVKRQVR